MFTISDPKSEARVWFPIPGYTPLLCVGETVELRYSSGNWYTGVVHSIGWTNVHGSPNRITLRLGEGEYRTFIVCEIEYIKLM